MKSGYRTIFKNHRIMMDNQKRKAINELKKMNAKPREQQIKLNQVKIILQAPDLEYNSEDRNKNISKANKRNNRSFCRSESSSEAINLRLRKMYKSKPSTSNSLNRRSVLKNSFYNKENNKNNIRLRNKVSHYINKQLKPETVEYLTHNRFKVSRREINYEDMNNLSSTEIVNTTSKTTANFYNNSTSFNKRSASTFLF